MAFFVLLLGSDSPFAQSSAAVSPYPRAAASGSRAGAEHVLHVETLRFVCVMWTTLVLPPAGLKGLCVSAIPSVPTSHALPACDLILQAKDSEHSR
mmetsp:Transcript_35135/g.80982  ORF Transcript_35135/g.80982 Transcript_35135/m.80982 type:complete len:96 (+) Transcript_35135:421-708(+)